MSESGSYAPSASELEDPAQHQHVVKTRVEDHGGHQKPKRLKGSLAARVPQELEDDERCGRDEAVRQGGGMWIGFRKGVLDADPGSEVIEEDADPDSYQPFHVGQPSQ
jgi:hypothetical protein